MRSRLLTSVLCLLLAAVALPATVSINSGYAQQKGSRAWSIVATYPIPEGASGLAYDGTYLYCGIYGSNGDEIYRINPATGAYSLHCTGTQDDAFGMTWDGSNLWITDHPGSSSDPADAIQLNSSCGVVSQFDLPDHYMSGIAYDNGDFWVATYYPDPATIYKVDGSGSVIKQFTAPDNQPWDLCLQDSVLWMADYWGDALYAIDTASGALIESHAAEVNDPAGIVWDGAFLWYCDNGSGGNDYLYKIDLSGAGTPAIYVHSTEHDYGTVTLGDSPTWNVTVENSGTADLDVTGVSFTGSADLLCSATFPITLSPTDQTTLPITWSPSAHGELNAIATVESTDPINPGVDITLTGDAVYSGPEINIPSNSHDYGSVRNGAYTRWFMAIENLGDATLSIEDITSDDIHFMVDDGVSFPLDIGVLSSTEVGIWFHPESAVPYGATLTLINNDSDEDPSYVSLTGEGLEQDWPMGTSLWSYLIDESSYDNSPKAIIAIPDVTGDGVSDVIIGSEDDYIRCFNGNAHGTGDVIWEHEIYSGSVYSQNDLAITVDVDDDGYPDVVVGSCWGGKLVRTLSGKTGAEIWTYYTNEYGDGGWVYMVDCSYDYNSDGVIDVLACAGDDSGDIGPKRAFCINGKTGDKIWDRFLGGPGFSIIGVEDFTGNGLPDVIVGASNEDETAGFVYGLNGEDGSLEWTYPVNGTSVWGLVQIDDITGDGIRDIAAGDFSYSGGYVYGLDATNGHEEWVRSGFGLILRLETLDDVNGNGYLDIAPSHSSSSLRLIDCSNGEIIWMQSQPDKVNCVRKTGDISGDGINDLMVGTLYSNNYCVFVDATDGEELHSLNFGTPVDALGTIPDIVGDGSWEMVAGGRDGTVHCYSGGLDAVENDPPTTPTVEGPTSGSTGTSYSYNFMSTDPDADPVYYYIEWGDDSVEVWAGPYASGEDAKISHTWEDVGSYSVRARARDEHTAVSLWSEPLTVEISLSYVCGDADASGEVDIDDVVYLINYIFVEGPEPDPYLSGDADCSGTVDIDDAVYLIGYIFSGGYEPCDPDGDTVPDC